MPSALVTGGAGFLGSHVVSALLEAGWTVTVLDDLSSGRRENVPDRVSLEVQGIQSAAASALIRELRPDSVVHLAAQASVGRSVADPRFDLGVNVDGTLNIALAAAAAGATFAFASSAAVYGRPVALPIAEDHPTRPMSPYGLSKLTAENYLGLLIAERGSWLRIANAYGPRQRSDGEGGVVAIFCAAAARGSELVIHGDGTQTRDFVHAADVAAAFVAAASRPAGGAVNVGTRVATSVADLARHVASGSSLPVRHEGARPGDIDHSTLDGGLAAALWGWAPRVPLADGLAETRRWFESPNRDPNRA